MADPQPKGKDMGAKLVKVIAESGSKVLPSGSTLHKYVADLLVDGAEVKGAKVAVWGDAENTAFKAGTEMASRYKVDDKYGPEYNLSGTEKAGGGGGGARSGGGGYGSRPPRYEDSEVGFYARQRGIVWCNALTAATTALGLANGEEETIRMARAFYKAGVAEAGVK